MTGQINIASEGIQLSSSIYAASYLDSEIWRTGTEFVAGTFPEASTTFLLLDRVVCGKVHFLHMLSSSCILRITFLHPCVIPFCHSVLAGCLNELGRLALHVY
jgi:hypothetical protein